MPDASCDEDESAPALEQVCEPAVSPLPDGSPSLRIAEVVDRFERPLLAYAAGMLRDRSAAQDAVQETFLQLCRKSRESANESASGGTSDADNAVVPASLAERLAPWLFTVCRPRVIDMKRKRSPDSLGHSDQLEMAVLDPGPSPDASAQADEDNQRVAESIGELSPRQREVLQLRMQAGLSYREIAEVTGLTTSNVGFHLHQAVNTLRQTLATS